MNSFDALSSGVGLSLSCTPGAPLYLALAADAQPSTSARCCDVGAGGSAGAGCDPAISTGSFGALTAGPFVTSATADDADDADAAPGTLSVGDTLQVIFNTATSTPLPTNAAKLLTFALDGVPTDIGS